MAMELGLITLWVAFLRTGPWKSRAWLAAAALFAVFLFVMLETSTRLVFTSLVAGLVLIELFHRRPVVAGGVIVASVLLLGLQPNLAGRIASTVGEPAATPAPTTPTGPPAVVEEKFPGDPSLRYRLYIWYVMLPEWAESPVLGRGTGSFAVLLERRTGIPREAPHNDYFGLLVETGLVGLGAYLLLQLSILAAALTRWRLARLASSRALLVTAGVAYFAMSVLSILNNPMLYLDLQVILWALLGVAFAVPRLPPGHPPVVSAVTDGRRGIASAPSQLVKSLRLIWRDRPTELAAPSRVGSGVLLAARLADVPLTVAATSKASG
jgi:O-antigen ligase